MVITIQNITKSFGADVVLKDVSAVVDRQDRVGIIGENGAGKTTLMKLITGELSPDVGEIVLAHGAVLGYLEQNSVLDPCLTVYGEMERVFAPVLEALSEMKAVSLALAETPDDAALLERHARLCAVVDAADGYNRETQIKIGRAHV